MRDYNLIYSSRSSLHVDEESSSSSIDSSSSSAPYLPHIEQTTRFQTSNLGTSIPMTLGSSPTPENILLAFLGVNQFTEARSVTPPDSTWNLVHSSTYL